MQLPEIVAKSIDLALKSDRKLSWKVQDSEKGTLIQLVWKSNASDAQRPCEKSQVCSKWKEPIRTGNPVPRSLVTKVEETPSRKWRDARCMNAFLDRKSTVNPGVNIAEMSDSIGAKSNQCDDTVREEDVPWVPAETQFAAMHESVRSDCLSGPQDTEQVPAGTDSLSQSLQDPAQKQREIHDGGVAALKHQLEGGEGISFRFRDNLPGLLYTVNGKENWTAVRVLKPRFWMDSKATASGFDDSEDEYDVNFCSTARRLGSLVKMVIPLLVYILDIAVSPLQLLVGLELTLICNYCLMGQNWPDAVYSV